MNQQPDKVIYSMVGVSRYYDKKAVLKDIYLGYFYGAKIGVLGLNGSGKSTLLRIIAGVDQDYQGQTVLSPGYSIGYLEQEPTLDESKTVRDIVEEGVQEVVDLLKEFDEVNSRFAEPMSDDEMNKLLERQGEVQEKLDAMGGWDLDSRLEMAMDALRCPPGETPIKVLSGGERRRVALCRLLLKQPDILLLDEPTNHLDAETVGWLEQKQERLRREEKSESARQKTLERELEWIRMAPKARHAKSKARIKAYESLLNQEVEKQASALEIYIPPGLRLGDVVIEAENVSKGYGDKLLFEGLSFKLPPGGIVGVIGPNGAGKTTLFRLITGQEQADGGEFKTGSTVQLGYVDQSRESLEANKNIWEEISGGQDAIQLGARQVNSRAYVARFNFSGADQQKKVGSLSGGERNRVHLAKMLKSGVNTLLLD